MYAVKFLWTYSFSFYTRTWYSFERNDIHINKYLFNIRIVRNTVRFQPFMVPLDDIFQSLKNIYCRSIFFFVLILIFCLQKVATVGFYCVSIQCDIYQKKFMSKPLVRFKSKFINLSIQTMTTYFCNIKLNNVYWLAAFFCWSNRLISLNINYLDIVIRLKRTFFSLYCYRTRKSTAIKFK